MNSDPVRIVADGYDRLAGRYAEWIARDVRDPARARYRSLIDQRLPAGAAVLDLGCATGAFITAHLAARFAVTGVDISPVQLEQARTAIPNARFIQADMTRLQFPPASFDAVVAFYSLNHLPRETLPALLRAIAGWLRPGGLFVAAFPTRDDPGTVEPAWLGVPMFFSGFDAATNERLVRDAGLVIEQVCREPIDEAGSAAVFLWIVAQTPARR